MRIRAVFLSLALFVWTNTAQAFTTVFVNDPEGFFAAAGDVRTIDFETLPDGSPSIPDVEITPGFNYTDQGVTFASHAPTLRIGSTVTGEYELAAIASPSSDLNWIIADFVTPVTAVGMFFPGHSTLSLFDSGGSLISEERVGGGTPTFLGIIADDLISVAIQNEDGFGAVMYSFFFVPVPEPGSLLLLAIGGGAVLLRGRARHTSFHRT